MNILLILVGIGLIALNIKATKKEKNSFLNIMNKVEQSPRDYDKEIISIRKDMAESILDLQKEIEELRKELKKFDKKEENDEKSRIDNDEDIISEIDFDKISIQEKVRILLKDGLTDDEICTKLSIGKGEVQLIRSLLK